MAAIRKGNAIQPDKLANALLALPDDGLVARFLWAWPDKLPTLRRPRQAADMDALASIYRKLESLHWGQDAEGRDTAVILPLSDDAANIFERWQQENATLDGEASSLFKCFVGKMDGTVLRLALVAEHIAWAWDGGQEPREVSAGSLVAAAAWVDDYAKPMAERVYGDASLPKVERLAVVLARYIVKEGFHSINLRTLKRSPHKSNLPGLRSGEVMSETVTFLLDHIRTS